MVQRLALLFGSIAAAAVLAVALAASGFAPTPAPTTQATVAPAAPNLMQAVVDQASPQPTTQVDTIYVKPAAPPRTIRVVKIAPTKPPNIVHRVVRAPAPAPAGGGESDGGSESD